MRCANSRMHTPPPRTASRCSPRPQHPGPARRSRLASPGTPTGPPAQSGPGRALPDLGVHPVKRVFAPGRRCCRHQQANLAAQPSPHLRHPAPRRRRVACAMFRSAPATQTLGSPCATTVHVSSSTAMSTTSPRLASRVRFDTRLRTASRWRTTSPSRVWRYNGVRTDGLTSPTTGVGRDR
jgi:hypothetical protein